MNLAVNLLLLFLVVMYFALVWWTYSDAQRRIEDPMIVACATAASLFPFVGTVVYLIVRPPEYLEDVRERELEIAAAEARLASVDHQTCPYCNYEIEKSFLVCPSCMHRLKEPCTTCGKPLDPRWKVCPYCEAEVGAAPPSSSPARAPPPPRAPRGGHGRVAHAGRGRRAAAAPRDQAAPSARGRPSAKPAPQRQDPAPQRQARPAAERPAADQPPQRERPPRPARS